MRYRVIVDFMIEGEDLGESQAIDRVMGLCNGLVNEHEDLVEVEFGDVDAAVPL